MKAEQKAERAFGPFTVGCLHCDMWFESVESYKGHSAYWHQEEKKEGTNGDR